MTLTEARDILANYKPHQLIVRRALRFILDASPRPTRELTADERADRLRDLVLEGKGIDIFDKGRDVNTVAWRSCVWRMMRMDGYSLHEIGRAFGFSHSTVHTMTNRLEDYLDVGDPVIRKAWGELNALVNS